VAVKEIVVWPCTKKINYWVFDVKQAINLILFATALPTVREQVFLY